MNIPDLINGAFELVGSIALWANVAKLRKDKKVSGVYWPTTAFFAGWGLWNCFYYPWLGQWASFAGGCLITAANIVWAGLALYYIRRDRKFDAQCHEALRVMMRGVVVPPPPGQYTGSVFPLDPEREIAVIYKHPDNKEVLVYES